MSRTLTVIRHSKAVHDGARDIDRALASRGRADAAVAGRWLLEKGIAPDTALVSPSLRTRQTWQAISAELGVDAADPTIAEQIYDNTVEDLLEVVHAIDPDATSVVIIGHNPSIHDLVLLIAADPMATEPSLAASYPTSAISVLDVPVEWAEIGPGGTTLRDFVVPRAD
jgi:phosphohistidine phosphatase